MKMKAIAVLFGVLPLTSYACRDLVGRYQCKDYVMEISKTLLGYRLIESKNAPIKLKCEEDELTYSSSIKEDGVTFAAHVTMIKTAPGVHITTIATLEGIPVYFERADCTDIK